MKTLRLSSKSNRSAAAGPIGDDTVLSATAHHDQIKHVYVLPGIALGTSPRFKSRLFSLRIRQAPVYWEPPGGPAPGREPRKGCLANWLFPSGNAQLPSVLGSAGWFRHQGASPGVFWQVFGSPLGRHGLPLGRLPPSLSPYEIRSPRRPMWSYTGLPPPLQVVMPRIRSHEAMSRTSVILDVGI